MPNPSLSEAIKEAYAVCPSSKIILQTLEIRQTGVQAPIYLVQSRDELQAADENGFVRTFRPSGFQFTLPPENEDGFRSINVAVDNIGREVSDFVQAAMSDEIPVEMVYRAYLSDDLSGPQNTPPLVLYLKDLQITSHQVTGRATFFDIVNKNFPSELYTRSRFPALG